MPPVREELNDSDSIQKHLWHFYGMTELTERERLFRYARDEYTGVGEIVDLGSWLGSTVVSSLEGLTRNPRPAAANRRVFSFDRFTFDRFMAEELDRYRVKYDYKEGDLFVDAILKILQPWADRVKVAVADLAKTQWDGGPIEFLVVDAMKDWDSTNGILSGFFGSLMPGISVVFHQDYGHYSTPWILLVMHRLRDYFEPIGCVPKAYSVLFRNTRPIPKELLTANYDGDSFSEEEIEQAYREARSLVWPGALEQIGASRVRLALSQTKMQRAKDLLVDMLLEFPPPNSIYHQIDKMWLDYFFWNLNNTGIKFDTEQRWLSEFAPGIVTDEGQAVVLGRELAAFAMCIGEGLFANSPQAGQWNTLLLDAPSPEEIDAPRQEIDGDHSKLLFSYLADFRNMISPSDRRVHVVSADQIRERPERPVELMLIDRSSLSDLDGSNGSIVSVLERRMPPGRAVLCIRGLADVADWPMLHSVQKLRENFEVVDVVPQNATLILRKKAAAKALRTSVGSSGSAVASLIHGYFSKFEFIAGIAASLDWQSLIAHDQGGESETSAIFDKPGHFLLQCQTDAKGTILTADVVGGPWDEDLAQNLIGENAVDIAQRLELIRTVVGTPLQRRDFPFLDVEMMMVGDDREAWAHWVVAPKMNVLDFPVVAVVTMEVHELGPGRTLYDEAEAIRDLNNDCLEVSILRLQTDGSNLVTAASFDGLDEFDLQPEQWIGHDMERLADVLRSKWGPERLISLDQTSRKLDVVLQFDGADGPIRVRNIRTPRLDASGHAAGTTSFAAFWRMHVEPG